jgi:hypothetical protein
MRTEPSPDLAAGSHACLQGHSGAVVEQHRGDDALRVSVAVVEGEEGPIALLPSSEDLVCLEALFLEASLEQERRAARREVWRSLPPAAWAPSLLHETPSLDKFCFYFPGVACAVCAAMHAPGAMHACGAVQPQCAGQYVV